MTTPYNWYEPYTEAVLETDWENIQERLDAAESAMHERQRALSQDHGGTPDERQEQADGFGVVYAGTEPSAVFRSDNGGDSWVDLAGLRIAIYSALRVLFPNQVIRADDLARAMVDVVVRRTREPGNSVFENRDIRAMVASLHIPAERSNGLSGSYARPTTWSLPWESTLEIMVH